MWLSRAEKWNQCSPRDSSILSLSTVMWNLQIGSVPHRLQPPHRPAISALLYFAATVTTLRWWHHLRFKLMFGILKAMLHMEEIKLRVRNAALLREATLFGTSTFTVAFHSPIQVLSTTLPTCSNVFCHERWTCAVGDWCKQTPDTQGQASDGAWVRPFKSGRKDLQWNCSGCFLSVQRHWKRGTVPVSSPLARGGVFIENCSRVFGT